MGARTPNAWRRSTLATLALLAGLCLTAAPSLGETSANPFSASESQRLRSGELVTRATTEERGSLRLMGGTSWQIINAPPAAVFRALLDTSRYSRMLPTVTGSELISEESGYRLVRMEHKKGPLGISYNIGAHVYPERRDITFLLEQAPLGLPRAAWGFFSVREYGTNQALLSYGVMADPGDGFVLSMLRSVVHDWMLRVPLQVKHFVESQEGRSRYY
jgi:hypothetical protein